MYVKSQSKFMPYTMSINRDTPGLQICTYTFRYAEHGQITGARSQEQPLPRSSRWEVVVLVRIARRAALSLDTNQRSVRFFHGRDVLVVFVRAGAVDDLADLEDTRADLLATLDTEAFPEASHVVCARTR